MLKKINEYEHNLKFGYYQGLQFPDQLETCHKLLKGRQLVINSQSVKGEITTSQSVKGEITTHVVISAILNKCKNVITNFV